MWTPHVQCILQSGSDQLQLLLFSYPSYSSVWPEHITWLHDTSMYEEHQNATITVNPLIIIILIQNRITIIYLGTIQVNIVEYMDWINTHIHIYIPVLVSSNSWGHSVHCCLNQAGGHHLDHMCILYPCIINNNNKCKIYVLYTPSDTVQGIYIIHPSHMLYHSITNQKHCIYYR